MKLYTPKEFDTMISNVNCKEDLKEIANHVHQNKDSYGHLYIKVQFDCMEKLKQLHN